MWSVGIMIYRRMVLGIETYTDHNVVIKSRLWHSVKKMKIDCYNSAWPSRRTQNSPTRYYMKVKPRAERKYTVLLLATQRT
jgi:hypothetical protein